MFAHSLLCSAAVMVAAEDKVARVLNVPLPLNAIVLLHKKSPQRGRCVLECWDVENICYLRRVVDVHDAGLGQP
jgi:hypothetical protein